jgi:tRNA pseudouridine32 synthase/23S rRNA pseudouridine746 synthase
VVAGELVQAEGVIDLPLVCDWPNRPRQMVDHERGKPSQTRYRVLSYDPVTSSSRVELEPITGRSHQLRVHMIALGHPILGDRLYGTDELASRLLLHASRLSFTHPIAGESLDFQSQPDF